MLLFPENAFNLITLKFPKMWKMLFKNAICVDFIENGFNLSLKNYQKNEEKQKHFHSLAELVYGI